MNNFGQIPDEVRYNNKLTAFARLMYIDILSLAKKENYCFANNKHFAELYNVSQKTVSISIKELEKNGCIKVEITKNSAGTYRKIKPLFIVGGITKTSNGAIQKSNTGITKTSNGLEENVKPVIQKCNTGVEENVKPKEYIKDNIEINIENNILEDAELENSSHTQQNENFENDILQLEPLDDEPIKKIKKVAQKKEKEIVKIYPHNFSSEMIRAADEFFEYRKEIKKPLKSEKSINTKMNQWSKEINQYGEKAVIESINSSIANGYQGTFIKLDKNYQNGFNNNNTDTFKEFLRKGSNFEL